MLSTLRNAILIVILPATALFAGTGVTLNTQVDKRLVTIGDRVNFRVSLVLPEGAELSGVDKQDTLGDWEVKKVSVSRDEKSPEKYDIDYLLTVFSTGTATIPSVKYSYTEPGGSEGSVETAPLDITVESVLAKSGNSGDIRDIKGPVNVDASFADYLKWILILLAAGAAAFMLYKKYFEQKLPQAFAPPEPKIPPGDLAAGRLEKLKASGLVEEGRIKEFYIELNDIIREYLEGVYGIDTLDRTTAEIYSQLRAAEHDRKLLVSLREFLDECDLVKFAKYRPENKDIWQAWERASEIVKTFGPAGSAGPQNNGAA